jgi:tRNA(Arg) A34 adenosine deaminase TadA
MRPILPRAQAFSVDYAQRTIELTRRNVAEGGRPFAMVIVEDGEILGESANRVVQTNAAPTGALLRLCRLRPMRATPRLVQR